MSSSRANSIPASSCSRCATDEIEQSVARHPKQINELAEGFTRSLFSSGGVITGSALRAFNKGAGVAGEAWSQEFRTITAPAIASQPQERALQFSLILRSFVLANVLGRLLDSNPDPSFRL
jgi:hypothetical protein